MIPEFEVAEIQSEKINQVVSLAWQQPLCSEIDVTLV